MTRWDLLGTLLFLAACGGNGGGGTFVPSPGPAVTIPDLVSYAAQSRGTNGDASVPLLATDRMIYRRFDMTHQQASDSFLVSPTEAITTWSYAPWGPFVAADEAGCPKSPCRGDGGEKYVLQGDALRIVSTEDGGAVGVRPLVPNWTVLTTTTKPCSEGWTRYNQLERGCTAQITFPGAIAAECAVSEHTLSDRSERIFLCKGWGRLAWQSFDNFREPQADIAAACPDFGWNTPPATLRLTDCRVVTNIEPTDGKLTGAQLWHP